jgi:hypothetical protein
MTGTWSRDDRLSTGDDAPTIRIGREAASGHVGIQVNDSHLFTMSDKMRDALVLHLGAL